MNRAEARRLKREEAKKKATYNLTREQIDKIKLDAINEALDKAFTLMLALPIRVLQTSYPKIVKKETRLNNFMTEILKLYEAFNNGEIDLQELNDLIYNETGVSIENGSQK